MREKYWNCHEQRRNKKSLQNFAGDEKYKSNLHCHACVGLECRKMSDKTQMVSFNGVDDFFACMSNGTKHFYALMC